MLICGLQLQIILNHFVIETAPFTIIPSKPRMKSELPTLDRVQHAIESSRHAAALQEYALFAKPVGEGTSKGILTSSKIKRPKDLAPTIDEPEALYGEQDILLETFLSGSEITVGIVGTGENSRIIGANEYVYQKPERSNAGNVTDLIDFAMKTRIWMWWLRT